MINIGTESDYLYIIQTTKAIFKKNISVNDKYLIPYELHVDFKHIPKDQHIVWINYFINL